MKSIFGGDDQYYQKEMNILKHIKHVDPRVKKLHTTSFIIPVVPNRITLSKCEYKEFETELWIVICKMKE